MLTRHHGVVRTAVHQSLLDARPVTPRTSSSAVRQSIREVAERNEKRRRAVAVADKQVRMIDRQPAFVSSLALGLSLQLHSSPASGNCKLAHLEIDTKCQCEVCAALVLECGIARRRSRNVQFGYYFVSNHFLIWHIQLAARRVEVLEAQVPDMLRTKNLQLGLVMDQLVGQQRSKCVAYSGAMRFSKLCKQCQGIML